MRPLTRVDKVRIKEKKKGTRGSADPQRGKKGETTTGGSVDREGFSRKVDPFNCYPVASQPAMSHSVTSVDSRQALMEDNINSPVS